MPSACWFLQRMKCSFARIVTEGPYFGSRKGAILDRGIVHFGLLKKFPRHKCPGEFFIWLWVFNRSAIHSKEVTIQTSAARGAASPLRRAKVRKIAPSFFLEFSRLYFIVFLEFVRL